MIMLVALQYLVLTHLAPSLSTVKSTTSVCVLRRQKVIFARIHSVMLAFSDYTYTSPPTWVDNVGPIFTLYDKVSPYMHGIMDMSA